MEKLKLKVLPASSKDPLTISFTIEREDLYLTKAFYKQYITPCLDHYLTIEVKKWYRERSLNQNKLWHKMLRELSAGLQTDMELIKQGIKEVAADEYGYPSAVNPFNKNRTPKPSSQATVKEMGILIETTFIEGGQSGVDLSEYANDYRKLKNDRA